MPDYFTKAAIAEANAQMRMRNDQQFNKHWLLIEQLVEEIIRALESNNWAEKATAIIKIKQIVERGKNLR